MKLRFGKPIFKTFHNGTVTTCDLEGVLVEDDGETYRKIESHAITRLAKGDTMDPVKACHIAESKAKLKVYEEIVGGLNGIQLNSALAYHLAEVARIKAALKMIHLRNSERKHVHDLKK